ncbi:flavodoxin [Mucilaginibacter sp. JRF]|uniref:flavodoxin family protein n=1 Tax=Mucilaginibacter sp. JRF TaxID=2780088 RepID=UPI00187F3097|nr:flavodoxin [Mucilaginibacter sp. JRF]MBE9586779.1 flavodoxin [Mucilaginibacter sp. JRF]
MSIKSSLYTITLVLFSVCLFGNTSCAQQGNKQKVLIVYLSRTGNTQAVAKMINEFTGGDLVELELKTPYPANYQTTVNQVAKENETGYLPPLKTRIDGINKYDVVFIGFPTWGMQLPPPMKSFLSQYDLKGKTVIPFNTNAGYGIGSSFETVKQLCKGCNLKEGFTTTGGKERDAILFVMKDGKEKQVRDEVKKWLKDIGIIN